MESLESLEFWECAGITNAGAAELVALPRLRDASPIEERQSLAASVEAYETQ